MLWRSRVGSGASSASLLACYPPHPIPLPLYFLHFRRIPPWASDDSNSRARVSCGALDSMAWSRALGELRAPLDGRLPHSGMRAHCCLCWPSWGRATAYLFPFSCLLICPMRLFSEETSFRSISPPSLSLFFFSKIISIIVKYII